MRFISSTWVKAIFPHFSFSYSPLRRRGLPGWLRLKEPACNAGDPSSIPGSGRSPGEGSGNPLQHSCLENLMVRGA